MATEDRQNDSSGNPPAPSARDPALREMAADIAELRKLVMAAAAHL
jgi:hypothetical protein